MKPVILVAAHKPYPMPDDPVYLPVQAGRALHAEISGFTGDDTGDNISAANAHYCELTVLYWGWKNLDGDLGLVHYRRYFARRGPGRPQRRILHGADFEKLLARVPVLLPAPRRYFIETNYSHYMHAHHAADLDVARMVIAEKFPEYLPSFDRVMRRTWGHRFNMFVMRRDVLDPWCEWLFQILFALEERLDISNYDVYNSRVFGFIGERLLDVYLDHCKLPYLNLPTVHLESQHWPRKIWMFLRRKFSASGRAH